MSPQWVRRLLLAAASALVVLGVFGLLDTRNVAYAGYSRGPDNDVLKVMPGSPAEAGGLLVGDRILKIGGISLEDTKALARRPRAARGETRTFVVMRDGNEIDVDITYGAVPQRSYRLRGLYSLVGLCFLGFGLWAYLRVPGLSTLVLALFGISFGSTFLPWPYADSFLLRVLAEALASVVVVMGFAFLVHYLMTFPRRRPLLDRSGGVWWIYGPAVVMAGFLLFVILFQPDLNARMRGLLRLVTGLFILGYFGLAVVSVVGAFVRATPEERSRFGLGLMLGGTVLALVPFTLSSVATRLFPGVPLPGSEYYSLLLGLIPVTFALAAVRRRGEAAA